MPARHLPILDGLRAIAVLLVLWCHVPTAMPSYPAWLAQAHWLIGPGGLGVEIFFVLSGFLITRILIAEQAAGVPLRWFLLRRLLRICPIYYLLLLALLPWRPADEIAWCALYLHNLRSLFVPTDGPLDHTWSLCIEEHFYLLWPVVVAFTRPRVAPRLLAGAMVLAIVGAVLVCVGFALEQSRPAVQHGSPFRVLSLGAGCMLAYGEARLRATPQRAVALAFCLLLLSLLLHPHIVFLLGPYWLQTGEWIPLRFEPVVWLVHSGALGTGIVLLGVVSDQARWSPFRLLTLAPLRAIGRLSYALYLYHLPIYVWLMRDGATNANAGAAIALTFVAATVSYFCIERPIQRFGSRFRGVAAAGAV